MLASVPRCIAACLLATAIATPAAVAAPRLPAPVVRALADAGVPAADFAVVVQQIGARRPVVAHNADRPMNPASVMKLVTTYAGLELLGPAHVWRTEARTDAPPVDGRLAGNLYLIGGGDPLLTYDRFGVFLRELRARGIRDIAGDVVVDRRAFAPDAHDPAAFDNEPLRPYNAGPDAALVNFHSLSFTLVPAPGRRGVDVLPQTPDATLRVDNRIAFADGPCGDWREALRPSVDGDTLRIDGSFAAACGEKTLSLSPFAADRQLDGLFRALWHELGGSFGGRVRGGDAPAAATPIATRSSPPLAEIVREINKWSNNVMARQLFLALGRTGDAPATADAGRRRVAAWLAAKGLDFPELSIENGAGLSRTDRISAGNLARLLAAAWDSPVMPEFVASLPLVGVDGTLEKRLADTPAAGRGHLKTGYLADARALAGYFQDHHGRRWIVACLANGAAASRSKAAQDALLEWLAERP